MTRSILIALVLVACAKKPAPTETASDDTTSEATDASAPETMDEAREAIAANFQRMYFDLDSSQLAADSRDALVANAAILQDFPELVVEVQGHADERGTTDYNLALGERRASSVRDVLIRSGVGDEQVRMVSFGEEAPAMAGQGETVWSKNRRVEFRVLVGRDGVAGTVE